MMSKELRRVVESAVLKVFTETLPKTIGVVIDEEELEYWGYYGLFEYVLGKITKEVYQCTELINEFNNSVEYIKNEVDTILKNWLYARAFNVDFELTLVED